VENIQFMLGWGTLSNRTTARCALALAAAFLQINCMCADIAAPSASLTSAPNVNNNNAGGYVSSPYLFTITYSDDVAIDATTLGDSNVLVSGVKGFTQLATFVSATPAGNGTPIIATYQFSPPGGVTNFGNDDAYTISMQPTQVKDTSAHPVPMGKLGNFTISILTITSTPFASPNPAAIGQSIQFTGAAAGNGALTYTWDFKDGITAIGSPNATGTANVISHVYQVSGTFPVELTVTDAFGQSVSASVDVTVTSGPSGNPPPSPGNPGIAPVGAEDPDADADGDGFTNGVEVALGSDPLNPASTPFALRANPLPNGKFKVEHLITNLVFSSDSSDQIYLTGDIQRVGPFVNEQTTVIVDIGHVVRAFKLDSGGASANSIFSNGQANSINDSFSIRRVKKNVLFTLHLRGNFQSAFASEPSPDQNLTMDQGSGHVRNVRATIYINNFIFQNTFKGRYFVNGVQAKFGR
jgi:hypothetical protein